MFLTKWLSKDWCQLRFKMADCAVESVLAKVSAILSPVGLESHPFKVEFSLWGMTLYLRY